MQLGDYKNQLMHRDLQQLTGKANKKRKNNERYNFNKVSLKNRPKFHYETMQILGVYPVRGIFSLGSFRLRKFGYNSR